jgi:DNA-binding Lrp family transcriptional regulator
MEISTLSRKILRDLCMDSRVSVTELAERYGITRKMVKSRIDALERELGLKYTLELNYEKLGFMPMYIARVKFSKSAKDANPQRWLASSKPVQLAVVTKGDFDVLVFVLVMKPNEYFKWEMSLFDALAKCGVKIKSSQVTVAHLGFIPIKSESIMASNTNDVYRRILTTLNENSRITWRELGNHIGISSELTKYYLRKLDKTGLIKRYTAVATRPTMRYSIAYFVNYTVRENILSRVSNERRTMYWNEPKEFPVLSEFQMMLSTTGSDMSFTWAVYDDYDEGLKRSVITHKRIYKIDSPEDRHATVEKVIAGMAPFRNMDQKESYDATLGESAV